MAMHVQPSQRVGICHARRAPAVVCRSAAPQASTSPSSTASKTPSYFIVNNVFKVKPEHFENFEETWKSRESHLKEMPGFIRFSMMKCVNVPGKYVSQTFWADRASFDNWAKSPQFQASHSKPKEGQGNRPPVMTMLEGPPAPELFETVTVTE